MGYGSARGKSRWNGTLISQKQKNLINFVYCTDENDEDTRSQDACLLFRELRVEFFGRLCHFEFDNGSV